MKAKIHIGALISGGGTNLQAIIDACEQGRINGQMRFVGSDKTGIRGLRRATNHQIPTFSVDYGAIVRDYRKLPQDTLLPVDFNLQEIRRKQNLFDCDTDPGDVDTFLKTRAIAEKQLLDQISAHSIDLLILAGFMRNLTPYFIDRFNPDPNNPRIMNIHPALLPAFAGIDGYGDTFRYGCKVGGCTVHFVDYGEDTGPIIGQRTFSILEGDDLAAVKSKGLQLEWQLYPECIELFARGRLAVVNMTHTLKNGSVVQRKIVRILNND